MDAPGAGYRSLALTRGMEAAGRLTGPALVLRDALEAVARAQMLSAAGTDLMVGLLRLLAENGRCANPPARDRSPGGFYLPGDPAGAGEATRAKQELAGANSTTGGTW